MTTTSDQGGRFKVLMHHEIGDLIDESFSGAMDGAIAVAQIYDLLPQLHRPKWWHVLIPSHLRVYRGFFEWGGAGFSYVQIGTALHVLDGGCAPCEGRHFRPDIVLPAPDAEKYVLDEENHGDGVSVLTIG